MNFLIRCLIPRGLFTFFVLLLTLSNLRALEREIVISVYQGPCEDGDFSANLETVRRVTREALERGSDFLAFPETFLSGYSSADAVREGARRLDDPELGGFISESAEHKMVILVGLARIDGEELYNTALVIQGGKLLGTFDKVMLTGSDRENLSFSPGKDMPVFSAHGVRFGVIICHDTSFPHLALIARLKGAEVLFTPHYNYIGAQEMDDHRKWVRNCHVGLACQMKMVLARSNVVVTDKPGHPGYGHSFIMSPQGEMLAEAELFRRELITARVGPEMFKHPYVWADLSEVPPWVRKCLAELLVEVDKP